MVIKLGNYGMIYSQNNETFFLPALLLDKVVDPTGAGDSFAGGFMGYLSQTDDISFSNIKRALVYASTMASFCVQKFGSEGLEDLSTEVIESRKNKLLNLTDLS